MSSAYKNPEIVIETEVKEPPRLVCSGKTVGDNPVLECRVCGHTEEIDFIEYHTHSPFHCMNCRGLNEVEEFFYNVSYVFNGNSHHCGIYVGNFLL